MYLCNRRGSDVIIIKRAEYDVHRLPQLALNDGANRRGRNRRDAVLQMRQLFDVFGRQNIRTGGEHLSQLDENRPQRFERQTQLMRLLRMTHI